MLISPNKDEIRPIHPLRVVLLFLPHFRAYLKFDNLYEKLRKTEVLKKIFHTFLSCVDRCCWKSEKVLSQTDFLIWLSNGILEAVSKLDSGMMINCCYINFEKLQGSLLQIKQKIMRLIGPNFSTQQCRKRNARNYRSGSDPWDQNGDWNWSKSTVTVHLVPLQ